MAAQLLLSRHLFVVSLFGLFLVVNRLPVHQACDWPPLLGRFLKEKGLGYKMMHAAKVADIGQYAAFQVVKWFQ
jgi:hypothetical protein